MRIDKKSMVEVLHREHAFSDGFVAYLLARNILYDEGLVDQLFNSAKRDSDTTVAGSFRQGRRALDSNRQYQSVDPRRERWSARLARGLAFS
jgi:hypothetical protein